MSAGFGVPMFCIYKRDLLPSMELQLSLWIASWVLFLSHCKVVGAGVISFEEMKISFSNFLPCLLAKMAKVASLVTRPQKDYIHRLVQWL